MIKLSKLAYAVILGCLGMSSSVFAQSLADTYGVQTTYDAISGKTNSGLSFGCNPTTVSGAGATMCTYSDGSKLVMGATNTSLYNASGTLLQSGTSKEMDSVLSIMGYTMIPDATSPINAQQIQSASSGSSGSSTGDVIKGVAAVGAVGAAAYAASELLTDPATQAVMDNAKAAAEAATKISAVGIEASMKELDKISDSLASKVPQHDLRFGPTPTGDVFTFCNGPRPGRHSSWRYWYDYLCSHGQKNYVPSL